MYLRLKCNCFKTIWVLSNLMESTFQSVLTGLSRRRMFQGPHLPNFNEKRPHHSHISKLSFKKSQIIPSR